MDPKSVAIARLNEIATKRFKLIKDWVESEEWDCIEKDQKVLDVLNLVLTNPEDFNTNDSDYITAKAIAESRLKIIQDWLQKGKMDVYYKDKNSGRSLLHNAAAVSDLELAKLLIKLGVDIDKTDANNKTPLNLAIENDSAPMVTLLLQRIGNVKVDEKDDFCFMTPLEIAAALGRREAVTFFLAKGASLTTHYSTVLHAAAMSRSPQVCDDIIKAGVNVNATDDNGCSPLHQVRYSEVIEFLLAKGADIHFKNEKGESPLHSVSRAEYYNADVVEALLSKGADINFRDNLGRAPIHAAAQGNIFTIKTLLQNGADIHCRDNEGRTPIHCAAEMGNAQTIGILLKSGASVHSKDDKGKTPIHLTSKNSSVIDFLIANGADVHCEDNQGKTPVHRAEDNITVLIEKGVEIHKKDSTGRTPLHRACKRGIMVAINELLKNGARVNVKDNNGITPLHLSCGNSDGEGVAELISKGADVNAKNKFGRTPLHEASKVLYVKFIDKLIKAGALVNSRDNEGRTALHTACANRNFFPVGPLLEWGADMNLLSYDLCTALDDARNAVSADHMDFPKDLVLQQLERFVKMMKSADMYMHPNLFKVINEENMFEFEGIYYENIEDLQTKIGDSDVTYHAFLQKNVRQMVAAFRNPKLYEGLKSERYKRRFDPRFAELISNHFRRGYERKLLIDQVLANCSEVFEGLPEECVDLILSYFNNEELLAVVNGYSDSE